MSAEEDHLSVHDTESEEESIDGSVQEESSSEEGSADEAIPEVTLQLDNLHLNMGDRNRQPTPAQSAVGTTTEKGGIKVHAPVEFSGRRDQLKAFMLLVKVSAAIGAVLGLADVAMHSCICSVTGVCIYSVYKHVAPTFSDRYQSSTIDLLFCSTGYEPGLRSRVVSA
jgi:hypothetical protein